MSWIGGLNDSFTQLTSKAGQLGGQLSSFTKEVLSETTDEEIDIEAEVKALRSKLLDAEAIIEQQHEKVVEQQRSISTLEEQCRRSELDAHSRICQYEAKLEKQTKLLNKSKQGNDDDDDDFHIVSGDEYYTGGRRTLSGSSRDAADYDDVISYQRQVARLTGELEMAEEEKERWKSMVEKTKHGPSDGDQLSQERIHDLEVRLRETTDRHQHEYIALQQANASTIQRLQDEIRILRSSGDEKDVMMNVEDQHSHKQALSSLQIEVDQMKEKLRTKNRQLQVQKKTIDELRSDVQQRNDREAMLNKRLLELEDEVELKQEGQVAKENEAVAQLCTKLLVAIGVHDCEASYETVMDRVKALRQERDSHHERVASLTKQVEELRSEKYELVEKIDASFDGSAVVGNTGEIGLDLQDSARKNPLRHLSPLHRSSTASDRSNDDRNDFFMVSPPQNLGAEVDQRASTQALNKVEQTAEFAQCDLAEEEEVIELSQKERKLVQVLLKREEDNELDDKREDSSSSVSATVAELHRKITELQHKHSDTEKDKTQMMQEKEQLQNALMNLEKKLDESITNAQADKDHILVLKNDLEGAVSEKMRLETLVQTISEELDASRIEKTALEEALESLDEQHRVEMEQILQMRDELKNKVAEKDLKLQQVNEEILKEEQKKVAGLEEEHKILVDTLQEEIRGHVDALKRSEEELVLVKEQKRKIEEEQELAASQMKKEIEVNEVITGVHEAKLESLKSDFDCEINQVAKEYERKEDILIKEKDQLEHENFSLKETIKHMELEISAQFEKMHEEAQESISEHADKVEELKSHNEQLTAKLDHNRSFIVTLEEENKRQIELLRCANEKHEQECVQLQSAAVHEANQLRNEFCDEKENLRAKHGQEIKKIQQEHLKQVEALESKYAEESQSAVSELKATHDKKCESLQKTMTHLTHEVKRYETESRRAQEDAHALKNQLQEKELGWKEQTSQTVEQLKAFYGEQISRLESENDELVQSNMHQVDKSINNELVQSQLLRLQQDNSDLHSQIKAIRTASSEETEQYGKELQKKQDEISNLNKQIQEVTERNYHFEKKTKSLTQELESLKMQKASVGQSPAILTQKLALTRQGNELVQGISTSCPDLGEALTQDLNASEKVDLSKEDISTQLALIKKKDAIISRLRQTNADLSAQIQAKASSDVDLKHLIDEKEQMLNVISDKTKENRQLKDELHKMVDVIAAKKNALTKVQEENQALVAKYEGFDHEMTKETVARLSKLISAKDLEIESLRQKCQTLLDVLQQQEQRQGVNEASPLPEVAASSQQIQALLRDRETLTHQVQQLLAERNHLVAVISTKHQEAVLFQEKAQKAADDMERDAAENSRLQVAYNNLVHDYNQIEMQLNSVKKEASRVKESLNHLEELKEILLTKIDVHDASTSQAPESSASMFQMPEVMQNLRSDSSKSSAGKSREELERIAEKNSEALLQKDLLLQENSDKITSLTSQTDQLQLDLKEKDLLIHQKSNKLKQVSEDLAQKTNEVSILRKSVENLREQVSAASQDAAALRERLETFQKSSSDKQTELQAFQETNAQLSVLLKEREYELEALREKVGSLNELLLQQEQGKSYESQKYLNELDRAKEQATNAKHERDQMMLSLKQKQMETQRSNEEAKQLREKEAKLQMELTRLRTHLMQIEETYTQEAILAGDREQVLRERLEEIQNKTASAVEANQQTRQQVESLQEQVRTATQQRDQALHNFQLANEQSSQYASALQQLQLAAERMQREEAATYAARVDKINQEYRKKMEEAEILAQQVQDLTAKLEEANIALKSASRLNEQLEAKEQSIDALKRLVSEKQLEIENLQDELHNINAKSDNMIDRQLVKNLFISYISSPVNKQNDVVKLISSMIGFTKEEESKLQPKKGWVSGWLSWGRGGENAASNGGMNTLHQGEESRESFTSMFVKFLEEESSAKQPAAKLPATAMVNDAQQRMNQRKTAAKSIPTPVFNPPHQDLPEKSTVAGRYNPFLATSTTESGATASPASSSSHLLLQPLGSVLPTFAPVTKSSERDILAGILQNES